MLVVLLAMLLIDPLQHAMAGQYEALTHTLQHDQGTLGLSELSGMLCANTLMQVGIQMFGVPAWRSFVLVNTALYGLFFLIHQMVHVAGGEALALHTVLNVTHYLLAVSVVVAAYQRCKASAYRFISDITNKIQGEKNETQTYRRKHRLDPGLSLLLGRRGQQGTSHLAFANHGHGQGHERVH
jgi:hypothetical protein